MTSEMKTLIIDTETSGLPSSFNAEFTDTNAWPRIVEIAWLKLNDKFEPDTASEFIVKPSGFKISKGAAAVHCITNEKAHNEGQSISHVLACLNQDLNDVNLVVAHNIDFDFPVINCEFLRSNTQTGFIQKSRYCTMKSATRLCTIPGNYGPKWPKLGELYEFLFNRNFTEAHRAMHDVAATAECYVELVKRGIA